MLNPEKLRFFMYISVNSVRKRISIVLFTQLLKYLHRPIGIEYWNLKLKIFIQLYCIVEEQFERLFLK